jgi:glycosyltransferase involved in cell wall biosynthesis
MRIAVLSTPFVAVPPAKYGGTELMVHHLVEGLVERGHDVALFATGDSRTSAELRSLYQEAQWPPDSLSDVNHFTWALAQMQHGEFDLVHAHCAGALACCRFVPDLPLIYTLHHARQNELSAFYRYFPAAYFAAISADQARREVPLARLEVIHHGLDPANYEWSDTPDRYVCFVGRFAPVKGLPTAIRAAAAAGVPIRVAGGSHPVDAAYGEREIRPRLAEPHVTFLGSIGMAEKVPLLRDARALLAPITWNEPFGLVLIEAMLSGCPVVAYGRGSVPELVDDGVTGFIVRNEAEMAAAIADGGPAARVNRRRCRARAIERFSCRRMVDGYERLYERAVAEADGAAVAAVHIA